MMNRLAKPNSADAGRRPVQESAAPDACNSGLVAQIAAMKLVSSAVLISANFSLHPYKASVSLHGEATSIHREVNIMYFVEQKAWWIRSSSISWAAREHDRVTLTCNCASQSSPLHCTEDIGRILRRDISAGHRARYFGRGLQQPPVVSYGTKGKTEQESNAINLSLLETNTCNSSPSFECRVTLCQRFENCSQYLSNCTLLVKNEGTASEKTAKSPSWPS
jgi:hypothetical protein